MAPIFVKIVGNYLNSLSYLSKNYAAEKALLLFSKPRTGQISKHQAAFLDTSIKETLNYDSHTIMTYRWIGTKQTILLVHGWESNSGRWQLLISQLKDQDYNIIALDAPAHGRSGSEIFNALIYSEFINVVAQKFQPNTIIGHSVGGMSTVFFQNKYQLKSIKKIILLGTPSDFIDVLKRYNDMLGYNKRIINQLNAIILERFGALPESFSTAKYIETINSEGLVIHDENDKIIPFEDALLIKNNFKNSKLISTKGFGHSLNNKTITSHILEFIDN